ncbi:MAG: molybdenum cofactor guanylyltransferase, partial [Spirochaetaceae bacterium]|nr:molybdenum cofactor guanylyltransferase [Spirochaetaceae bacterium]
CSPDSYTMDFASQVIRNLTDSGRPVIGLKVSTIQESDTGMSSTDTDWTYYSGLAKTYRIMVRSESLSRTVSDFLGSVPPDTAIVCESNSLRMVLEPGLFLVVCDGNGVDPESTDHDVINLADRIVDSDANDFDLEAERITWSDGHWHLQVAASAVVLAGGASSRMGKDKALISIGGQTLIDRNIDLLRRNFDEVLVSSGRSGAYSRTNVRNVSDGYTIPGPVAGILTCLEEAYHESCFFMACDIPNADPMVIRRLLRAARGKDGAVPRKPDGRYETLYAVYRKSIVPAVKRLMSEGETRIRMVYDRVDISIVDLAPSEVPANLNTQGDYRQYMENFAGPEMVSDQ